MAKGRGSSPSSFLLPASLGPIRLIIVSYEAAHDGQQELGAISLLYPSLDLLFCSGLSFEHGHGLEKEERRK